MTSASVAEMLFLTLATVWILWYVLKKIFPGDVGHLQFFLIFIVVIIPFVMLVYFGLALINYDEIAIQFGWPSVLPLKPFSPPIIGAAAFYIGLTVWLWSRWHKLVNTMIGADRGEHRQAAGAGAQDFDTRNVTDAANEELISRRQRSASV